MSAKLLYSLSDDNQNLQKQLGCMNGFLQFFERRHLISNRNTTVTQGENSGQGREGHGGTRRSKEKHEKIVAEMAVEGSRLSVSSSTGSTLSIVENEQATKAQQPPIVENIFADVHSQECRSNRTHSTPNTSRRFQMKNVVVDSLSSCASPIRTPKRDQVEVVRRHATNHIDSPRLMQPSKLDSPRFAVMNESFRSVSTDHSPLRRKDSPRMSYDGTETREAFVSSGFKVRDLPRLSLDSRQRTINKSNRNHNLPEEPASYRSPSNVVAKLMGLDTVSDCSSSNHSQICRTLDSLSRSSRSIDETKLNRVLDSPRSKYKDLRTPQSTQKAGLVRESKLQNVHQEVDSEPGNHFITVYGEIEKRLADIDFKRSGKDLRALKQILEAMHREKKSMLERTNESQCSSSASHNSTSTSQKQAPEKENRQRIHTTRSIPQTSERARLPEGIKSPRSLKQDKPVKGLRDAPGRLNVRNEPSQRMLGLAAAQPMNTSRGSVENRAAKDPTLKANRCQYSAATSAKPLKSSKVPLHIADVSKTNPAKNSESLTTKTITGSRTKHNQQTIGSHSQERELSRSSTEFSTETTCRKQQRNPGSWLPESNTCFSKINAIITSSHQSPLKHDPLQQVSHNKHPVGIPSDGSSAEPAIAVREQPSPVSVLDSTFYEDESPSPVRKRPTTFQGFYEDDNSTEASNETEGKDAEFRYSPYSMTPSFSHGTHEEQGSLKQSGQIPTELKTEKTNCMIRPLHKETNLDNAYVAEILLVSGFLNNLDFISTNHHALHLKEAINPNLFFILERTSTSKLISDSKPNSDTNTRTHGIPQRKLLFDAVNEFVSQKLACTGFGSHPRPFLKRPTGINNGQHLLQEICKEINQLQLNSSNQSLDDEDDFLTTIIEKDLTHRSGNWTDTSRETSGLVLDIERLIFKDLIVELIHDEASRAQAQKPQTMQQ